MAFVGLHRKARSKKQNLLVPKPNEGGCDDDDDADGDDGDEKV